MNVQTNVNDAANTGLNLSVGGLAIQSQSIKQSGRNLFKGFNLFL